MFFADQDDYIYWLEQLAAGILAIASPQSINFTAANAFIYPIIADITVTLPLAVVDGRRIVLVNINQGGFNDFRRISINPNGNTLDASSATQSFTLFERIELMAIGGAWYTVADVRDRKGYNENALINGAFDIAQRATSYVATTTAVYGCADRWFMKQATTAQTTFSQAAPGIGGFKNGLKVLLTGTSTGQIQFGQIVETVNAQKFAGKQVVVHVRAIKGSTWNPANLGVVLVTGTGTDQGLTSLQAATWTGQANTLNSTCAPAATAGTFRFRVTVPTTMTEMAIMLQATPTGAAVDANSYLIVTGISIKEDPTDTFPYQHVSRILRDCMRYYQLASGVGSAATTSIVDIAIHLSVEMRTTPTITAPQIVSVWDGSAGSFSQTSAAATTTTPTSNARDCAVRASNFNALLTATRFYQQFPTTPFAFSAEL